MKKNKINRIKKTCQLTVTSFLLPTVMYWPAISGAQSNVGSFSSVVTIQGPVNQTATGSNVKQDLNVGSAQKSTANTFNSVVTTGAITQTGENGAQQFINVGGMNSSSANKFDANVTVGRIEQIGRSGERQEMDIGSVTNSTVSGTASTRVEVTKGIKQTGSGEIVLGAVKNSNVRQFESNLSVSGKVEGNNIRMGSVVSQEQYDDRGRHSRQQSIETSDKALGLGMPIFSGVQNFTVNKPDQPLTGQGSLSLIRNGPVFSADAAEFDFGSLQSTTAKEFDWDDIRNEIGGITGLINAFFSEKYANFGNKSAYQLITERHTEEIRILNNHINIIELDADTLKMLGIAKNDPFVTETLATLKDQKASLIQKKFVLNDIKVNGLGAIGAAINTYELIDAVQTAEKDIKDDKATFKAILPVLEKAIAFQPLAGATLWARDELVKVEDLTKGINETYETALSTTVSRYNQQFHIIADKGFNAQDPKDMIDLFSKQRDEIRASLDQLTIDINESLPFPGRTKLIEEVQSIRNGRLSERYENSIIAKQEQFYQKFYAIGSAKRNIEALVSQLNH